MCGISGFFLSSPSLLNKEHLQRMTDVQTHRGPDAAGYFFNDFCGLGHRRLSILDLSEAATSPFIRPTAIQLSFTTVKYTISKRLLPN